MRCVATTPYTHTHTGTEQHISHSHRTLDEPHIFKRRFVLCVVLLRHCSLFAHDFFWCVSCTHSHTLRWLGSQSSASINFDVFICFMEFFIHVGRCNERKCAVTHEQLSNKQDFSRKRTSEWKCIIKWFSCGGGWPREICFHGSGVCIWTRTPLLEPNAMQELQFSLRSPCATAPFRMPCGIPIAVMRFARLIHANNNNKI